jgi:hypothetical protein
MFRDFVSVGDFEDIAFLSIGLLTPIYLEGIGFLNIPPAVAPPDAIACLSAVPDVPGIRYFCYFRNSWKIRACYLIA